MIKILRWSIGTLALVSALFLATPDVSVAAPRGGGGFRGAGFDRGFYGRGYGRGYYGGYGGWGYGGIGLYGGYGYYPYADYGYNEDPSHYQPVYPSPYLTSPAAPGYVQGSQTATPAEAAARIKVEVPDPNATVTFDGVKTTSTGTVREFETVPLATGQYRYEIKATWMQDGHLTTQTKSVLVTPGAESVVNFIPG